VKKFFFIFGIWLFLMALGGVARANFFENKGQWPEEVLFHSASPAGGVWICKERIIFDRFHPADVGKQGCAASGREGFRPRGHVFSLRWDGASFSGEVERERETSFYLNYFIGNDPAKWASYVRGYARVTLRSVWPGIDVRLTAGKGLLKYDFVVHPGADAGQICWHYTGADEVVLRHNEIHILTSAGAFIDSMPACWAECRDGIQPVEAAYWNKNGTFGISTEKPTPECTIVIDPELIAATYLGVTLQWDTTLVNFVPPLYTVPWTFATGFNSNYDNEGNIYGTSQTGSLGFPITEGAYIDVNGYSLTSAGWAKFSPDGSSLIFGSVIGSNNSYEGALDLMIDESTQTFLFTSYTQVDTYTCSLCFPETLPPLVSLSPGVLQPKLHFARFNWDSSELLAARFICDISSVNSGLMDMGYRISKSEIAPDGNYLLACSTANDNFPVTPGSFNTQPSNGGSRGAILRITPDLETVIWGTFVGSVGTRAFDLKVLPDGNLLVGGRATSGASASVTTPDGYLQTEFGSGTNAFVSIVSGDGTQLLHGTILTFPPQGETNSPSLEITRFVDFDPDGNIYMCGVCPLNSSMIPCSDGVYCNEGGANFIAKFSPDLSQLLFVSQIGTPNGIPVTPTAFMVDNCGYIFLSGFSGSFSIFNPDPPLSADALQTQGGFYLAVYEPDMAGLHYATLYGGNHIDAGGSRFDKKGVVYQTVCDQNPLITDTFFQTTPNAWSATFAEGMTVELAIFKIDFQSLATTAIMSAQVLPEVNGNCYPISVQTNNYSTPGTYTWLANGIEVMPDSSGVIQLFEGGTVELLLAVYHPESCNQADTSKVLLQIPVYPTLQASWALTEPDPCAQGGTAVSAQWTGQNATSLLWESWQGQSVGNTFAATVTEAGSYTLTLTAMDAICGTSETLSYEFDYHPLVFAATGAATDSCVLPVAFSGEFAGQGATDVLWQWGNESQAGNEINLSFAEPGNYTVTLTATNALCNQSQSQTWTFTAAGTMEAAVTAPTETLFCIGETVTLSGQTNTGTAQWTTPEGTFNSPTFNFQPSTEGTFNVMFTATDPAACNGFFTQTLELTFVPAPEAAFTLSTESAPCAPDGAIEAVFTGQHAQTLQWNTGDGATYSTTSFSHEYQQGGIYTVSLTALNPPCQPSIAEQIVNIYTVALNEGAFSEVNIITPNNDGINDCLRFFPEELTAEDFHSFDLNIFNRWGTLIFSTQNPAEHWCADNAEDGTYYWMIGYELVCGDAGRKEEKGSVMVRR
jgi:PKD repeat protein